MRKMLQTVRTVQDEYKQSHMEGEPHADFSFPVLPGSHLSLADPVLEFVKFTCAVFSLSKELQVEMGILKRNLLELISVKEFSDQAIFKNPCDPLRLSMVACRYCDFVRDFDFCRDEDLFPTSTETVRWFCSECGCEYDRMAIEFALMQIVHRLERTFTQQDLKCSKCKQIQSDNVSRRCNCSGAYHLVLNKADFRRKLRTIVNVAIVHNLSRLKVSSVL